MSGKIRKETRIADVKNNVKHLIELLNLAENKEITLKSMADELNMTSQELNNALNHSFGLNIYNELLDIYDSYNKEWNKIVMSPIYLEGDILITDPCYWVKDEDWHELYFGNTWKHLGITKSICRDTLYGDWKCNIFNTNTNENLGEFCADSGMVCVCLLDEVFNYSKDKIKPYIENNSAVIIKDFKGTIQFKIIDNSLYIIGNGNINFISKQTGL